MISIVMIGCGTREVILPAPTLEPVATVTPYPTYTPYPTNAPPTNVPPTNIPPTNVPPTNTPQTIVIDNIISYDEVRRTVMNDLKIFNGFHNNFAAMLGIMGGVPGPTASPVILVAMELYEDALSYWEPPIFDGDNRDYTDRLEALKQAELERLQFFKKLTQGINAAFQADDLDRINAYMLQISHFSKSELNRRGAIIQAEILKDLKIKIQDVDFLYEELSYDKDELDRSLPAPKLPTPEETLEPKKADSEDENTFTIPEKDDKF